jgi:hypothetical protein
MPPAWHAFRFVRRNGDDLTLAVRNMRDDEWQARLAVLRDVGVGVDLPASRQDWCPAPATALFSSLPSRMPSARASLIIGGKPTSCITCAVILFEADEAINTCSCQAPVVPLMSVGAISRRVSRLIHHGISDATLGAQDPSSAAPYTIQWNWLARRLRLHDRIHAKSAADPGAHRARAGSMAAKLSASRRVFDLRRAASEGAVAPLQLRQPPSGAAPATICQLMVVADSGRASSRAGCDFQKYRTARCLGSYVRVKFNEVDHPRGSIPPSVIAQAFAHTHGAPGRLSAKHGRAWCAPPAHRVPGL